MISMKFKQFIKAVAFLVLLPIIILPLDSVFSNLDYRTRQIWEGFYAEPEGSLDAVIIGASNVYPYWNSMTAWEEYGIAVYAVAFPGLSYQTIEGVIDECRKTQPDALYIVSLNTYKSDDLSPWSTHLTLDYMNWGKEKADMVEELSDEMGLDQEERLENYFPFIRFHSHWSELGQEDYVFEPNSYKSASCYLEYKNISKSQTEYYSPADGVGVMTDFQVEALDSLMDHCTDNDIDLMFVSMPQSIGTVTIERINAMAEYVEEKGFNVCNLASSVDEMGMDLRRDWYNRLHVNVHGSIKFTHYLGGCIVDLYGFEDKRDDPDYQSWNDAVELYRAEMGAYCLDFEFKNKKRDYGIAWAYLYEPIQVGDHILFSWKHTNDAQGYAVYRCSYEGEGEDGIWTSWVRIATVPADVYSYEDTSSFTQGCTYYYTVVPFSFDENGEMMYGNFSYAGQAITYMGTPPKVHDITLDENGDAVVSWEPVADAVNYVVCRRRPDEPWHDLAVVDDVSEHIDNTIQPGVPYFYTVCVATVLEDNDVEYGAYDHRGVFFENGVTCPDPYIVRTEEGYLVSWDDSPWFAGFELCYEDEDGDMVTCEISGGNYEYLISYDDTDTGNELYLTGFFEVNGENVYYQSGTIVIPGGE